MREILFRGKRTDNGKWVYGSFCMDALEQTGAAEPGVMDGFIRNFDAHTKKMQMQEVDRETVGQYTGLADKDGKKVFEGDIVKVTCDRDWMTSKAIHPYTVGIGVIVWDFCSWFIKVDFAGDKRYLHYPDAFCHTKCEVIGNIHDNSELIGGDNE